MLSVQIVGRNLRFLERVSEELNIPVLGKMPIDTKLAELADGAFDQAENEYLLPAENRLMFL